MGLSKPIIIQDSSVDISNLATKSDIDSIKNSVGAVKKIQKGTLSGETDSSKPKSISATLSGFTDVNKMCVHLDGHSMAGSGYYPIPFFESSLTTTKLTITQGITGYTHKTAGTIHYTVIEYY